MASTSPRIPLAPLNTSPPIPGWGVPCSPTPRHRRTPSGPSPLKNLSFSAADTSPDDSPRKGSHKAGLQSQSTLSRHGKFPVDPNDVATLLGLKPASLRSVSTNSCDSDSTVRVNSNRNGPHRSPHNTPRNSPSRSPPNSLCDSTHNSLSRSPNGSPVGSGNSTLRNSPVSDAENIPPPGYDTKGHAPHKRKLSAVSLSSPQVLRKQAARRSGSSASWSDLPHAPSVSTPGGTFGAYPSAILPPIPAWLQDPSVLDVLAQLADEAQDPPTPATTIASSTWSAILKPRESPMPRPVASASMDVFNSPQPSRTSLFEDMGTAMPFSPRRSSPKLYSPRKNSTIAVEISPLRTRSPRTLRESMGQTTPTIPEVEEDNINDPVNSQANKERQASSMSPTKYARREATALAPPSPGLTWASSFAYPKQVTAQWILATSPGGPQAEPALSASMAALTLTTAPVDPNFSDGDVTLVCRVEKGHIGLKADSNMILTYFHNFPVLSQSSNITHVLLHESPDDIRTFLRFVSSESIDLKMTASEVLAIHRIYNLYEATELARLTLAFWVYQNTVYLCESLGMNPNKLELLGFLRLAADLRCVEIWHMVIETLLRGWWRNQLDPHRMTQFDVAVMGDGPYRALQFLAGHPGHVWDNIHEYSASRDECGNLTMSRVSATGYSLFVDSTL